MLNDNPNDPAREIRTQTVDEWLREGHTITRCPTVCVAPTHGTPSKKDQAAFERYVAETARARRRQRGWGINGGRPFD